MLAKIPALHKQSLFYGLMTVALLCGCGKNNPWEKAYPAKGTVTYKGKPVKDAELLFFPVDEKAPEAVRPWAKSNEKGEFTLSTYNNGDGAPAGSYKVTVVHHEVVLSGGSLGSKPNDLPKKYATQATTDLKVDIGQGETTIHPLELK